jgi:addiction module RelB/DinJ family antitoxin
MATTTVQLRTRVDRTLKRKSDALLAKLGLDTGTFVAMALAQLVNRRGIPFSVTESDEDYFAREYDLTPAEMIQAGKRMREETARARRAGTLKEIGSVEDLAG